MASYWTAFEWAGYTKKTEHLSITEHGAYFLLLKHYYQTEKPLSANAEVLLRVCRAFAEHEKAAVLSVLDQFFTLEEDGYHNDRADEEIAKSIKLSEKRRDAGKLGATKTNGKRSASAATNAAASAEQVPTQSQSQLHKEKEATTFDDQMAAKAIQEQNGFRGDYILRDLSGCIRDIRTKENVSHDEAIERFNFRWTCAKKADPKVQAKFWIANGNHLEADKSASATVETLSDRLWSRNMAALDAKAEADGIDAVPEKYRSDLAKYRAQKSGSVQ